MTVAVCPKVLVMKAKSVGFHALRFRSLLLKWLCC